MGDWTYMTNNMCFFCVSEKKRVEFLFELLSSIVDVGAPLKFRSARFFSGRLSGTFWYPQTPIFGLVITLSIPWQFYGYIYIAFSDNIPQGDTSRSGDMGIWGYG